MSLRSSKSGLQSVNSCGYLRLLASRTSFKMPIFRDYYFRVIRRLTKILDFEGSQRVWHTDGLKIAKGISDGPKMEIIFETGYLFPEAYTIWY